MSGLFDPITQARDAGASAIELPIINRPYEPPRQHWEVYDLATGEQHEPRRVEDRRPAGYFYSPRPSAYEGSKLEEEFVELACVNEIRRRVAQWREEGYRGVSPITRRLLEHWNEGRETPLFFCQREAVESFIWLHEAHPADRQGLVVPADPSSPAPSPRENAGPSASLGMTGTREVVPLDQAHEAFRRYCCKMATGTGKTLVMAMVTAWSALNKQHNPQATWCSDAVLIMAPGLTVKERLSVLDPGNEGNYYELFDLVPRQLMDNLRAASILILHRQELAIQDDSKRKGVVKLGRESDTAFANRLLKRHLGSKQRLLVLNDEGHHCYRPIEKDAGDATKDEKEENQRAAQWITGLEKIHSARGILTCLDLSATPFYIHGSGRPVGRPFPWIVSDFGLIDAIESGLVKIPQIPVDDNKGTGHGPPAYFHLWRWVNDSLPAEDRETTKRKAKPEAVARAAEPALITMMGNWSKEFEAWKANDMPVPPCMIVVCADTGVSEEVFKQIDREDDFRRELHNRPGREVTYLYDSKTLAKAEEGENIKETEARKRAVMNTVGKEGQPGEQVRCIVSVSMLTEGWDAQNVTQIVGLRAFTSQLLCEQVVGRALRRSSYKVNEETGMLEPEYADVYGVPFQVIPVRAKRGGGPNPPPVTTLVRSLEERKGYELRFPRVEGYVADVEECVVCDWESVMGLRISRKLEPTEVYTMGVAGLRVGRPDLGGPGQVETHDRVPFYQLSRPQTATFQMAGQLAGILAPGETDAVVGKRRRLFPQLLEIVRRYVAEYLVFDQAPEGEVALEMYQAKIVNVLSAAISAPGDDGSAAMMPRIERHRPEGSSGQVLFRTGRPCRETIKSHVSHVVLDSGWESNVVTMLEQSDLVRCYVRNDHLDFTVPFTDADGQGHMYRPDFIVKLSSGLLVALEIKGHVREMDEHKIKAGQKWAAAVNRYYGERTWAYLLCFEPADLAEQLLSLVEP